MKTKALGISILLCVFLIGVIFAGALRVEDKSQNISVTLSNVDTATYITDKFLLVNEPMNLSFDHLLAQVFLDTLIGSGDSVGAADTVIVTYRSTFGREDLILEVDTGLIPCTLGFTYFADDFKDVTILGDSTAVSYVSDDRPFMEYEHFYMTIFVKDTAGSGDTLTGTIQTLIRAVEDK